MFDLNGVQPVIKFGDLILLAAIALAAAQIPSRADASTVTYNLVLTATSGPESGSGSFTVTTPTPSTSFDTVGNGLTAMTFTIDSMTFNLLNSTSAGVGFNNNGLGTPEIINTINYTGQNDSFVFQLSAGGFGYTFTDSANNNLSSKGTIVATLAPAVPEPATWAMMILGFAGVGFMTYRRKQNGAALAVA
jgi:hypothetical protein